MQRLGEVYKAGSDLAGVPWAARYVVSCVLLWPRITEPRVPRPTSKQMSRVDAGWSHLCVGIEF